MKTKGSTSYTGVTIKELNKFFKEDAVIEVSKKFLNAHKMIAGENHVSLVVQKEVEPEIELKETQLDEEPVKKISRTGYRCEARGLHVKNSP